MKKINKKQIFLVGLITFLGIMFALDFMPAEAAENPLNTTIGAHICQINKAIMGGIGKSLAILAIIILGIGIFFKKTQWHHIIIITVGMSIIFGADVIANKVIGIEINCSTQVISPKG